MSGKVSPFFAGAAIGLIAVLVQGLGVASPEAYGVCIACHARDLVNFLANAGLGIHLEVSRASVSTPLLTTLGIILGAHIAARFNGEFERPTELPAREIAIGAIVMILSLLLMACTVRLGLRAAYGDPTAWFALGFVTVGVIFGVNHIRRRAG